MDPILQSECLCRPSYSSFIANLACKPKNRYLCYLLDEFEKCSLQSGDLSRLQKDHALLKKDVLNAQREIRDLKFEKQLLSDKVTALQREVQEQKLLHSQLRDEASSELRSMCRKAGSQEKDMELLKYQMKMNSKKHTMDLENLRWELSSSARYGTFNSSDFDDDSNVVGRYR